QGIGAITETCDVSHFVGNRIRSRPRVPITTACEGGHDTGVMCQIPAELGWSARFSPNRRSWLSLCCLLSIAKSVGYGSWHVWRGTCISRLGERGEGMAVNLRTLGHKTWRTIASIQTGVVLLILVVILAATGTIVLLRPATEPDEIQSAYSP